MSASIEATVVVNENEFRLVRYEGEDYEADEYYFGLWHMHPEREKKQGLISDGRKCMDCDVVAPEVIDGYPVEPDGYIASEWHKTKMAEAEADRLVREGWSDEKKAEQLEARRLVKELVGYMNMEEHRAWEQERKEQGNEYEVWTDGDDKLLKVLRKQKKET